MKKYFYCVTTTFVSEATQLLVNWRSLLGSIFSCQDNWLVLGYFLFHSSLQQNLDSNVYCYPCLPGQFQISMFTKCNPKLQFYRTIIKITNLGGLKQQEFILQHFWRLEVQNHGSKCLINRRRKKFKQVTYAKILISEHRRNAHKHQ